MSYVPLARKYRPQTFDELIGQSHVTTTLKRALEAKRVAQAYLFTGLRGVGKTSAARLLAKCLNCETGPTATSCNRCASCAQITQGTSLDVVEIDGASNRGIDEIRNLRETVPYAPAQGSFRIYIIDEVHMLTTEAFNALLKTLEEPPAHVKFIFATTAANKVPSTIISRCQRFDFRRIEPSVIVAVLKRVAKTEKIQLEEPALYAIARAADGGLRDAEVILDQLASFVQGTIAESDVTELVGAVESETLLGWVQAIIDRNTPDALTVVTSQLERGKDAGQLLLGLSRHLRNLLIVCSTAESPSRGELLTRLIDEPAERLTQLQNQAQALTTQEVLLLLQMATGAHELMRRSPVPQTILELLVIKLSTREEWQSIEYITQRLEQLAAGTSQAAGSSATRPSVMVSRPSVSQRVATPPPVVPATEREDAESPGEIRREPRLEPRADAEESVQSKSPTALPTQPPSEPIGVTEELVTLWPVFLQQLGTQKMSLAAYLSESQPLRLESGRLTIGLPGFALHQEVLNVSDNLRLITKLLSGLCHTAITVEYATLTEPVAAKPIAATVPAVDESSPSIVQDIVKLFNATLIDQPRTT